MPRAKKKNKKDRPAAASSSTIAGLKTRLQAAEETLEAIRSGGIDGLMLKGPSGARLFTVQGAENAYRIFVEAMTEGAVTIALDGTVLYSNRCFADMLRAPLDLVIGNSIFSWCPAVQRPRLEALLKEAQHTPSRTELSLLASDGASVPVYLALRSFQEFGSRAICAVITDLSQQKRDEQVVGYGNLARLILEQAAEYIAVCDERGRVILASHSLHQLCRCNALFQNFDSLLPLVLDGQEPGSEAFAEPFTLQRVLEGETLRGREALCRRQNEGRHLLLSASPIVIPQHGRAGAVVTLVDMEERRKAEEALRLNDRLAAMGRLAATIAHEINNPLTSVTNLLYLMEHSDLTDEVRRYVQMCAQELGRVTRITQQTLAFHRQSNLPTEVDFADMVSNVVAMYAPRIQARSVQIRKEMLFDGRLQGYAGELRQVLSNLVTNAIEAVPRGGTIRIRVQGSRDWQNRHRHGVRIIVADNGPGIPQAVLRRIFEPFYTTKGERGSGLGLWVSQGIVHKHHGVIRVRSRQGARGSGTVFSIFLPLISPAVQSSNVA
jgi:PAS domain S-box-containing protein